MALSVALLLLFFLVLCGGLLGSFLGGLSWSILNVPKFKRPPEGIWRAGRYALLTGLSTGLISTLLLLQILIAETDSLQHGASRG
ncbi:MAG: hypothetical protein IMW90_22585, partial [Thermogemmatispora sp.]|uniref:hypothetical protein n=1 Tax=Thermogemmatispora sp. TaxID=1968838 RepID=UPI0019DDEB0F